MAGKWVVKMSQAWAEKLAPPASGREEWHDQDDPCMVMRIAASGRKTWYVLYRVKGADHKKRIKIGQWPQVSLADARRYVRRVVGEAVTGIDLGEVHRDRKAAKTFQAAASDYLDLHAKIKKRSWKEDQRRLDRLAVDWGGRRIVEIKRKDVVGAIDALAAGAPIEANRTLALLKTFFNWALGRELVEVNPALGISPPGVEKSRERVLTDGEIAVLWRTCQDFPDAKSGQEYNAVKRQWRAAADVLMLELLTGQRGGEVRKLRWVDLDLRDPADAWWTVPREAAKNKRAQRVPLTARAVEILGRRQEGSASAFVFPGRIKRDQPERAVGSNQSAVEAIREASGLAFWPHDLRRTVATKLAELGVRPHDISQVLGHSGAGAAGGGAAVTARHYNLFSYDHEKKHALELWARRLEELLAQGGTKPTSS